MIARIWRGTTAAADADAYMEYLEATGLAEYRKAAGNRGVLTLRRVDGGRAEFVLISLWDSYDAIRAFTGTGIDRAVFYPEDARFLIERGERVDHFEATGWTSF